MVANLGITYMEKMMMENDIYCFDRDSMADHNPACVSDMDRVIIFLISMFNVLRMTVETYDIKLNANNALAIGETTFNLRKGMYFFNSVLKMYMSTIS